MNERFEAEEFKETQQEGADGGGQKVNCSRCRR